MNRKIFRKTDGGQNLQSKQEKQLQHIGVEITGSACTPTSFVTGVAVISAAHSNRMQDFPCAPVRWCNLSRVDRYTVHVLLWRTFIFTQSNHDILFNVLGGNIIIDLWSTDSSKDKSYHDFCHCNGSVCCLCNYYINNLYNYSIIPVLLRLMLPCGAATLMKARLVYSQNYYIHYIINMFVIIFRLRNKSSLELRWEWQITHLISHLNFTHDYKQQSWNMNMRLQQKTKLLRGGWGRAVLNIQLVWGFLAIRRRRSSPAQEEGKSTDCKAWENRGWRSA